LIRFTQPWTRISFHQFFFIAAVSCFLIQVAVELHPHHAPPPRLICSAPMPMVIQQPKHYKTTSQLKIKFRFSSLLTLLLPWYCPLRRPGMC
jgi:hypothetical protein